MKNLKLLSRIFNLTRNPTSFYPSTLSQTYSSGSSNCYSLRSISPSSLFNLDSSHLDTTSRSVSTSSTHHAKSKDRGAKEKKKPKAGSKVDLKAISEVYDVEALTAEMNEAIDNLKADFVKNLTLRSTTGSLEQIKVVMDKKEYEIQELAQVSRKPKLLVLNVAVFPTAIPYILKAIEKSGLNVNPQQDGTTIFCPIPKVTKEHRENLSKNAKAIYIRHRDNIKDIRSRAIKAIKKRTDVSVDLIRNVQTQIDTLCEKYVKEAESILDAKQDELLGS